MDPVPIRRGGRVAVFQKTYKLIFPGARITDRLLAAAFFGITCTGVKFGFGPINCGFRRRRAWQVAIETRANIELVPRIEIGPWQPEFVAEPLGPGSLWIFQRAISEKRDFPIPEFFDSFGGPTLLTPPLRPCYGLP